MNRRHLAGFGLAAGAASLAAMTHAQAQTPPAESTWDQVHRTGVLRVSAIAAQEPGFHKDPATGAWSGSMIAMAADIASNLGVRLEPHETTYGNSILDLQSNKIDLALALQETPKRALVINFTRPIYQAQFTLLLRNGFEATDWDDLNKPGVRIAADLGSVMETIARHFAPKAQVIGLADIQAVNMALVAGRADASVGSWLDGVVALKRNPQLGTLLVPKTPLSMGVYFGTRYEPDTRFVQFVSAWGEYNSQMGQTRQWIADSLTLYGLSPDDVPAGIKL
ncbi:MAG: transporter substrate-binding domain-containing protein [Acidisphaera sp.]|nr:transporter substrate-binding domain-containing protein [Acidisphaera sp.]MBV9813806.1 transporter substrate-binding domain-containing protein [Acetobacteraceae bacterium]